MSIMDVFKTKEPVTNPELTPPQPVAPTPAQAPEKMEGTDQTPVNPLDAYSKLFDTATQGADAPPAFKLDPNVLNDVSSKLDFTKNVPPELLQKATTGDVQALMEVIKSVGQSAYRASLDHATSLTDTYLGQRAKYDNSRVASGVHQQLTQQELSQTPNYSHPVVKAELNSMASRIARANPDYSPQQVANEAKAYIAKLSAALNPATPAAGTGEQDAGEVDWTKYLGG